MQACAVNIGISVVAAVAVFGKKAISHAACACGAAPRQTCQHVGAVNINGAVIKAAAGKGGKNSVVVVKLRTADGCFHALAGD